MATITGIRRGANTDLGRCGQILDLPDDAEVLSKHGLLHVRRRGVAAGGPRWGVLRIEGRGWGSFVGWTVDHYLDLRNL